MRYSGFKYLVLSRMRWMWLLVFVILVSVGWLWFQHSPSEAPEPVLSASPAPAPSVPPPPATGSDGFVEDDEPAPGTDTFTWHRPQVPSSAPPAAEAFGDLNEQFEAYLDQWGLRLDPETGRAEQDEQLKDALHVKAEAMDSLTESYREIADSGDGPWARNAEVRIGELQEEMAAWLELAPYPSYLTEAQQELYGKSIEEMAGRHRDDAAAAYEAALSGLPEGDTLHQRLTDRLVDLEE